MKNSLLILIFGVLTILSSCKKDSVHSSLIGSWNCDENSNTQIGPRKYQVSISRNQYIPNSTNEYIINNFHNLGITEDTEVYVRETEPGILTITGTASLAVSFIGSATVASDFSSIQWTYTVNDGEFNPNVRATYY